VLRGVGVLGMLATHIQSFSSVAAARANPTVLPDLVGVDRAIWLVGYVLADGKFLSIFGVLFGAALAIGAESESATRRHYRRIMLLFGVGLLHGFGLWYGDMLHAMAVCGALAFLYRGLSPGRQLAFGLVIFGAGSVIWAAVSWAWLSHPDAVAAAQAEWAPSAQAIAWEVSRYRGGWLEQMDHRAPAALASMTSALATRGLWQLTGLMLIGSALFRLGVLSAARSTRLYGAMTIIGFGAGVPIILYGIRHSSAHGWTLADFTVVGAQLNYWGGALVSMGWIGLAMLLCRHGWQPRALEAVGRMAFTNYLLQTVICTTIFYGHGLGLFGSVSRSEQMAIVLAIWIAQTAGSLWWSRVFLLGPLEWLLRSATQGRRLPIWLRSAPRPGVAAG